MPDSSMPVWPPERRLRTFMPWCFSDVKTQTKRSSHISWVIPLAAMVVIPLPAMFAPIGLPSMTSFGKVERICCTTASTCSGDPNDIPSRVLMSALMSLSPAAVVVAFSPGVEKSTANWKVKSTSSALAFSTVRCLYAPSETVNRIWRKTDSLFSSGAATCGASRRTPFSKRSGTAPTS